MEEKYINPEQLPMIMTVAEVARFLRMSRDWVYQHSNGQRQPQLPSFTLGGSRRYKRDEVLAFLDTLAEEAATRR